MKVVTANRLGEGSIVYLAADGRWSPNLADAALVGDEGEAARLLEKAQADAAARLIVGPYAMDAASGPDGPRPLSQRERIRATGPTVQGELWRWRDPRLAGRRAASDI